MLAYVFCKIEGRKKIKPSLPNGKGQIWWERHVILGYMEDRASSKENGHALPLCGTDSDLAPLWPYLNHLGI